jgi:hypothetical protein
MQLAKRIAIISCALAAFYCVTSVAFILMLLRIERMASLPDSGAAILLLKLCRVLIYMTLPGTSIVWLGMSFLLWALVRRMK